MLMHLLWPVCELGPNWTMWNSSRLKKLDLWNKWRQHVLILCFWDWYFDQYERETEFCEKEEFNENYIYLYVYIVMHTIYGVGSNKDHWIYTVMYIILLTFLSLRMSI